MWLVRLAACFFLLASAVHAQACEQDLPAASIDSVATGTSIVDWGGNTIPVGTRDLEVGEHVRVIDTATSEVLYCGSALQPDTDSANQWWDFSGSAANCQDISSESQCSGDCVNAIGYEGTCIWGKENEKSQKERCWCNGTLSTPEGASARPFYTACAFLASVVALMMLLSLFGRSPAIR